MFSLFSSKDQSQRNAWHPSRLLVAEEWVLGAVIAAVGICVTPSSYPIAPVCGVYNDRVVTERTSDATAPK